VFVVSRESFSVPPELATYYVNDALSQQDMYATAAGSNRSTGRTAGDPKPSLLAIMQAYNLDAGDTVYVNSGEYRHLGDAVFSGDLAIGNDEGVTVTGPTDPARVARLVQHSDRPSQAVIDVNNADFITIAHVTLAGAPTGLWAHNGSTDFRAAHIATGGHALDGLRVDTSSTTASLASIVATDNGRYEPRLPEPPDGHRHRGLGPRGGHRRLFQRHRHRSRVLRTLQRSGIDEQLDLRQRDDRREGASRRRRQARQQHDSSAAGQRARRRR
jgi:hypothetical protein